MNLLRIENDGPRVAASNFWESAMAQAGYFYASANAGALRLLVPPKREAEIIEMLSAREVVATKGVHRVERRLMLELLFDDGTDSPFVLFLCQEQVDHWFTVPDQQPRRFLIYTTGPVLVSELKWYYREADLPCLKGRV